MPRYRLTVAYDGTDFKGWQKQHPPDAEPLRTAQGVLEEAIRAVIREPVTLVGASRTDRGVHAIGQVAAVTCERDLGPGRFVRAVNSRLPDDLRVLDAVEVPGTFSPISEAVEKQYRYRIAHGGKDGAPRPLFDRRVVTASPERLDVDRMDAAARHIVGTHDFKAFTKRHHGRETTVRTVHSCRVRAESPWRLRVDVRGDGFLWNMVRIIAGTLLDVGRGRLDPDDLPGIIADGDRGRGGPTLPPEGLCLLWIRYAGDPPAAELEARAETDPETLIAAIATEAAARDGGLGDDDDDASLAGDAAPGMDAPAADARDRDRDRDQDAAPDPAPAPDANATPDPRTPAP